MKLKYKKIILLTSLSTMGIGLLTLSISKANPNAEEQSNPNKIVAEAQESDDGDIYTMSAMNKTSEDADAAVASPIPTSIPTPIPTPTPIPIYPLEVMEGMNTFIEEFYIAKAANDVDKLKTIYIDPSKVETREQLQNMVQYIEEYKNIKTYSKKGIEEGSFIVYAYHEIKFSSINTLAPGLSKFYVVTDEDGNYKIASDMSPMIEEYFNARNEDQDVLDLILSTNAKGEEAKAKDEDLMIFWNGLDELANSDEGQSDQTDQTDQSDQGN